MTKEKLRVERIDAGVRTPYLAVPVGGHYKRKIRPRSQRTNANSPSPQAHNAGCRFIESTSGIFLFARISRTFGANFPYWVR